jgi:serine kinase of HPr protein (carbohydrate metabolism regulator)
MGFLSVSDLLNAGDRIGLILQSGCGEISGSISVATVRRYQMNMGIEGSGILIAEPVEVRKLEGAAQQRLAHVRREICLHQIPCVIVSDDGLQPRRMLDLSKGLNVSCFSSRYGIDLLESRLVGYLREKIEDRDTIGGVLVTVSGKGVLIIGESGTGKSSSARALISRGARLVSDDVVEVFRGKEGRIIGKSHEAIKGLMEVKGIGVVDAEEFMGEKVLADESVIDMVVELGRNLRGRNERWRCMNILGEDYDVSYISVGLKPDVAADRIEEMVHVTAARS